MIVIISDASIKNNVVSSITYIHSFNSLLKKMLYHAISIMSTEVELFALRCEINQVCYESRLKGLSQETTLVLSNTRELDRVSKTK